VLNKAGTALREFVGVFWLDDILGDRIPTPIALIALDAVLMKQAYVEPDGRVEGSMLMQAEPG